MSLRVAAGPAGVVARVASGAPIERIAAKWMYVLRNRARWASDADVRAQVVEGAVADLAALGIGEADLRRVLAAPSRHVEVIVHDDGPSGSTATPEQRAAAAFPWEFALAAATTAIGRSGPLLVTRLLQRRTAIPRGAPRSFLFVQSAPGRLRSVYSFESERARLRAATSPRTGETRGWRLSDSGRLDRIERRVRKYTPDAIHVSGIDNHQAARLIPGFYAEGGDAGGPPTDGMVVRGQSGAEDPVPFDVLARSVVPDGTSPMLVSCNLYYSSARIAQEFVRRGAYASVGFQDEVNDDVAELFFQVFYRCWVQGGHGRDLARAFGQAWTELKAQGHHLFGTGIVLWLAASSFAAGMPALRSREDEELEPAAARLPTAAERRATQRLPMAEVLQVELKVREEVNYSLLHNARPFLEKLTLNKLVNHPLDEVSVLIELNAGDASLPFRHTETLLDTPQRSLGDLVHVPLTAPLLRSLRERVQTTLYARVCWDNRIAYEGTQRVTLLPVDEWLDDSQQNPWLPSFVLPRDPAVGQVIAVARRHLITLLDDAGAGFDGYQSGDDDTVDLQVQALWSALVHEFRIMYINPPPAYSTRTQRLRTPSEVIETNSGTCVDLALLLASCLEYVDIYPVVVLLAGHAFVGYWRSVEAHDEFRRVGIVPSTLSIDVGQFSRSSQIGLVDAYAWRLGTQQYGEVRQYLRADKLRFLEATGLCFNYSLAEAVEEGAGNLRSAADFDSLLDLRLARLAKPAVTPLPIMAVRAAASGVR